MSLTRILDIKRLRDLITLKTEEPFDNKQHLLRFRILYYNAVKDYAFFNSKYNIFPRILLELATFRHDNRSSSFCNLMLISRALFVVGF